ncbi:MAG: cell division ATP-binding protein FtsE [Flavobacteriia bacterium]|jgi:cell division transport system ATP-binding protein|nr:ATP-binding cassette domain-containing protein [Cryomorphaceae bacterium]
MEKVIEIKNGIIRQQNTTILSDLEFSVGPQDFVYLIGRTGSGKSTLLKAIYGELPLSEGTGTVAGFDLLHLKKKDVPMLRRKIGIVFQDFQLLTDRTVMDNLLFVLGATGWSDKTLMQKRAMSVLQLVGIEKKANTMPHALSGGEQQRISIARALLNKPALILADEPTGNLDPETSEDIMHLLIAVAKEEGSAVLMATHDMNMVNKFPGRVVRVEEGMLVEE